MSDGDALLRAVIEAPDEDAPRLVYADWLEEQGGEENIERAEFIRLQIERSGLGTEAPKRLARRERALLKKYAIRWAMPLRECIVGWEYRRGFIERVEMEAAGYPRDRIPFADRLLRVLAATPLRVLAVGGVPVAFKTLLAAAPLIGRLSGLEIEYTCFGGGNAATRALLTSPHLSRLEKLSLIGMEGHGWLNLRTLRAIIASRALSSLRDLTLIKHCHGLENEIIRRIARASHLSGLQRLCLADSQIDTETIQALGAESALPQLAELDLRGCKMSKEDWKAFIRAPGFRNLKRLWLGRARYPDGSRRPTGSASRMSDRQASPIWQGIINRFGPEVVEFDTEYPDFWIPLRWEDE